MRRTDRLRRLNPWRETKRSRQQRAFYTHPRLDFILKPPRSHLGLLNEEAMKVFQKRDRVHWRHIVGSGVEATEVEMILFKDTSHTGSSCAPIPLQLFSRDASWAIIWWHLASLSPCVSSHLLLYRLNLGFPELSIICPQILLFSLVLSEAELPCVA